MTLTWQALGTVLGVVAFVASAAAVLRAGYIKSQLEALRGDRDDLIARVGILERDNVQLRADLEAERQKAKVLENIATGRDVLAGLETSIGGAIRANAERFAGFQKSLDEIAAAVVRP